MSQLRIDGESIASGPPAGIDVQHLLDPGAHGTSRESFACIGAMGRHGIPEISWYPEKLMGLQTLEFTRYSGQLSGDPEAGGGGNGRHPLGIYGKILRYRGAYEPDSS